MTSPEGRRAFRGELLLGTSMATGAAVDDDRVVALVVLVVMFVITRFRLARLLGASLIRP